MKRDGRDNIFLNAQYAREAAEKRAAKRAAKFFRNDPDASVRIRKMTGADLDETLGWMWEEMEATGRDCLNKLWVVDAQGVGEAFVARYAGYCVGVLVVGRDFSPQIVATRPGYRRRGVGRALLAYSVRCALRRGQKAIKADCVTLKGRALCKAFGFVLDKIISGGFWHMTFDLSDPNVDLFI